MREGWVGDEYLILFEGDELQAASARYSFTELLANYTLCGLRTWDDFIVDDHAGNRFTVPTVPVSATRLAPFQMPTIETWMADARFTGKIKWYLKPLVFGGDPLSHENQTWISHDQHAQLVLYWNNMYRSMTVDTR